MHSHCSFANFLGGFLLLCWITCLYLYLLKDGTLNDVTSQAVMKSVVPRTACVGN